MTTVDDYHQFCRGVRALCRVDLEQYKRGQMERRIRTFAATRGAGRLAEYLRLLRRARIVFNRSVMNAWLARLAPPQSH